MTANFRYEIFTAGSGGPDIYWGTLPDQRDVERVFELVKKENVGRPFRLITYQPRDWNADFSPWRAPAVFDGKEFLGRADETLRWLTEVCIPQVERDSQPTKRFLAGYSLAGLFSLWALTKSKLFDGAASCSGSLWFDGWTDYLIGTEWQPTNVVFLSLGRSEKNTKIAQMATVSQATQTTYDHLRTRIAKVELEWNNGGHFSNTLERMARGISWGVISYKL